ncbi:MAG: tRNA lysidine(34) synthetase TilS, partial [Acidobacteriia bacterium]|nr:tRNA lysidine(34) synthetase TilS [Terriglobia bacterium]
VRKMAASLRLAYTGKRVAVGNEPGNLEERARDARQKFFLEAMREHGLNRVALGHTRNDQAETVLFRFLRGSGTAGLSGMRPVTPEGFVRPLMECSRQEVEEFLRWRKVGWREDHTNQDTRFARNRIRHLLLPALERDFNPNLSARLAGVSDVARDEERYWQEQVEQWNGMESRGQAIILHLPAFAAAPPALQRRLLRAAIARAKGDLRGVDLEHVERLRELGLRDRGEGRIQLPGLDGRRSFQWLRLSRPEPGPAPYRLPIEVPCSVEMAGLGMRLEFQLLRRGEWSPASGEPGYNEADADLDWETISGPLELRSWTAGDRYQRAGGGVKSIRNLFQQERVPSWERPLWPMIRMGDNIIWVRNIGAMDGFAAGGDSQVVLRVREVCLVEKRLTAGGL